MRKKIAVIALAGTLLFGLAGCAPGGGEYILHRRHGWTAYLTEKRIF